MILSSLMACSSAEPSMKRINELTKQLGKIEKKQEKTDAAFDKLVEDCARLDDFLRENNNPKPEMQLLRAYLQQYEDERMLIDNDIVYSTSQIKNLKEDFKSGLYDEAQRDEYLKSEEKVVNRIEAKLDYFLDRFEKQSEFIKSVEKQ